MSAMGIGNHGQHEYTVMRQVKNGSWSTRESSCCKQGPTSLLFRSGVPPSRTRPNSPYASFYSNLACHPSISIISTSLLAVCARDRVQNCTSLVSLLRARFLSRFGLSCGSSITPMRPFQRWASACLQVTASSPFSLSGLSPYFRGCGSVSLSLIPFRFRFPLTCSPFWCFASCACDCVFSLSPLADAGLPAMKSTSRRPFLCHIHAACIRLVSCAWARMTRSDDLTGVSDSDSSCACFEVYLSTSWVSVSVHLTKHECPLVRYVTYLHEGVIFLLIRIPLGRLGHLSHHPGSRAF
ncbi:hypothetical protein BJV78DRAFT_784553 [Lactifluus subvellereus]|nr:hypothetical protein BJV78DRAFT_784553 [Lactifluus subvellereus]